MTLFQAILFLSAFFVAVLVGYILVMLFEWYREDEPVSGRWEVGCRIRTVYDPHGHLPGVWRVAVRFDDGSSEWERIA
jgi:hypothetical protein